MRHLLLLVCLVAACDSPTSGDGSAQDVRGGWEYHATQTTPSLDIAGVLHITDQEGAAFSGTVSFTETDVQGTRYTRAGAVSGRIVGSDVADIDVYVDTQVRRHVGRVAADSMTGTWSVTGAATLSGSFTARRVP
ncbi:MAG TPA: hypothetical protein VFO52_12815 [Longimicrobiales bacterium]|nr:hypothetical protein [Longimicrobiales bacterium]